MGSTTMADERRMDDTTAADSPESVQLSLRGCSPRAPSWSGCESLPQGKCHCECVDLVYVDKCRSCMCGQGSTHWCNTACDPTGDDPENSCCQPFKQINETCGQGWECGPYGPSSD